MVKQLAVIAAGLVLSHGVGAREGDYGVLLGDVLVHADKQHAPEVDGGYGLDLRYGRVVDERWSLEGGVLYDAWSAAAGESGFHAGVGLDVLLKFGDMGFVKPFLIGGGGIAYSDLMSGTPRDPRAGLMFDLGAGVFTAPLMHLGELPLSARVQAKANWENYDEAFVDVRVYAGLQLALAAPAAPAPEPVSVVPAAEPEPVAAPAADVAAPAADAEPTIETAKAGDTIVLRGVNFNTAQATLTLNAKTILDGVAEQLAKRPGLQIEIGGHTDSVGNDAYNQDLAERRAASVIDYLASKGIDAGKLSAVGYGEGTPIDTNDTDEGREKNRRVELKIVAGDEPAPQAETPPEAQPEPQPEPQPQPEPEAEAPAQPE